MIDFNRLVAILCRDNPARERGQMIWVADQLLTWYRASVDVRTYGATRDGKPNPSAKAARDAAAILWGKMYKPVSKDAAIEYMEGADDGTEKRDALGQGGRDGTSIDENNPADLRDRGVREIVGSGSSGASTHKRNIPRKGRKAGVSKIPAHLRSQTRDGKNC